MQVPDFPTEIQRRNSWQKPLFIAAMQVHMAELNKAGTRLDAARRQFYLKSQKHLKEHVAKKDNTAAPPPREDSDATLSGEGGSAVSFCSFAVCLKTLSGTAAMPGAPSTVALNHPHTSCQPVSQVPF